MHRSIRHRFSPQMLRFPDTVGVVCIPAAHFRPSAPVAAAAEVHATVQNVESTCNGASLPPIPLLVALTAVDELKPDERDEVVAAAAAAVAPHPLRVTSARTHEGVEELKRELLTRTGLVGGVAPRPGGVRLGTPVVAHSVDPARVMGSTNRRCW